MPAPPTRTPATRRPAGQPAGGQVPEDYGDEYSTLGYQTEQQYKHRDSRAFRDIFDPDKTEGLEFFKPQQGANFGDIIPFPVGPRHPEVAVRKKMKVGQRAYVLEVWRHGNVGPNNDQWICLARTYGKPCPICEFRQTDQPGADDKELTPKRRSVFAWWDRKAEDKGVQVWEIAHYFMDKQLQARVINPKTGAKINFSHPSKAEGKHISFDLAIKGINREYTGHQFVDRDEGIPKWVLDQAPCLDDLLYVPTYEEVEEAFYGADGAHVEQEPELEVNPVQEMTCPVNGVFGGDYWAFVECETCAVQDVCAQLAPPVQEPEPEPPPPPQQPTRRAAAPPAPEPPEAPKPPPVQRPLRRQVT
jgi:hypothetical protein